MKASRYRQVIQPRSIDLSFQEFKLELVLSSHQPAEYKSEPVYKRSVSFAGHLLRLSVKAKSTQGKATKHSFGPPKQVLNPQEYSKTPLLA